MTRGLGLHIGTTRTITAAMPDGQIPQVVLTRRSTLTFGPGSTVRLGDRPEGAGVVSEFAHRLADIFTSGDGHSYTGGDLIAVAAHCMIAEIGVSDDTPVVLTHPAVYTAAATRTQRTALDRAGLARVGLIPAPLAVLTWFEAEHPLLAAGLSLVYEICPAGHHLSIVTIGAGGDTEPIVGRPLRATTSDDYPVEAVHIPHGSPLHEVLFSECLLAAGLDASALDVVVVVGAPPPRGLAEYFECQGMVVIVPPSPNDVAALGAALLAAASRPTTWAAASKGPRLRTRVRHLQAAAAAVVVVATAAALTVPWILSTAPAVDGDLVALFRPPASHGDVLLERTTPLRFPATDLTAPDDAAVLRLDLPQANRVPHVAAVTAPTPAPTDPIANVHNPPAATAATVTPATRTTPSMASPAPFTVPTPEPVTFPDTTEPSTEPTLPSPGPTPPTPHCPRPPRHLRLPYQW